MIRFDLTDPCLNAINLHFQRGTLLAGGDVEKGQPNDLGNHSNLVRSVGSMGFADYCRQRTKKSFLKTIGMNDAGADALTITW